MILLLDTYKQQVSDDAASVEPAHYPPTAFDILKLCSHCLGCCVYMQWCGTELWTTGGRETHSWIRGVSILSR